MRRYNLTYMESRFDFGYQLNNNTPLFNKEAYISLLVTEFADYLSLICCQVKRLFISDIPMAYCLPLINQYCAVNRYYELADIKINVILTIGFKVDPKKRKLQDSVNKVIS